MPAALDRESRSTLAALLGTMRFSLAISESADRTLGEGLAGNAEIQVLLVIAAAPGIGPSGIAEQVRRSRSAVSRSLSVLEGARLVRAVPDQADGRRWRLHLTPRGLRRVAAFEQDLARTCADHDALLRQILADLDSRTVPTVRRVLPSEAARSMSAAGMAYLEALEAEVSGLQGSGWAERFALAVLARDGAGSPSALSAELGLSRARISGVVAALTERRLVVGSTSPADRRRVVLRPTSRGRLQLLAMLDVFGRFGPMLGEALRLARAAGTTGAERRRPGVAEGA
jgi:DNA-binding MarR family transcriptional regulator